MNKQEEVYFKALSKDRSDSANTLDKPSMRGVKKSVVEKYSDQAHFIYELLQNADDTMATNARFVLERNRLIFAHNGTRLFSVSDPSKEGADEENGTIGDINSITSIGNSNKTEASIGKFGVGFKAVFQYTSTPHIYDPNFSFKIERFIVPVLLEGDFSGRRPEETMFVFPFDHLEKRESEAFAEISAKLINLSFPLLFLTHIKEIEFEFGKTVGLYSKEIKETRYFGDTLAERICLTQNKGNDFYDENLWLFSRKDKNNLRYSVGFFLDKDGHLQPKAIPAFCFFPTKVVTGLNFIVHAPFLLTDSREGIRAGVPHNDIMLQLLADLAADALVYLRDIGVEEKKPLIDDGIVNILPVDSGAFSDPSDKSKVSFLPFFTSIQKILKSEKLLPSMDGYVSANDAYWASVPQLPQLFSKEQLRDVVGNDKAEWVLVSLARDEVQRNNRALFSYLDREGLNISGLNEENIIRGRNRELFYNRTLGIRQSLENIKGISAEFIENQSDEWLHKFYKWLSETKHRTELASDKPIFIDQKGKAAAAYDEEKHLILFLPVSNMTGYRMLAPRLLENPETKKFVEQVGITEPALKDQIYNIILPLYRNGGRNIDYDTHFMLFFQYYCKCTVDEAEEFIGLIKGRAFLACYYGENQQPDIGVAASMYYPLDELKEFLGTKKDVRFIDVQKYKDMVGSDKEKQLSDFLSRLGVKKELELVLETADSSRTDIYHPYSTRGIVWTEYNLEGCKEIVEHIVKNQDSVKSGILWKSLVGLINARCKTWSHYGLSSLLRGTCNYYYYSARSFSFPSSDAVRLKNEAWLVNAKGEFVSAQHVSRETLSAQYDLNSDAAQALLEFLEIPDDLTEEGNDDDNDANLTESQKEKIEFANRLRALGFSEDDLEEFKEFKRQKEARKLTQTQQSLDNPDNNNTQPEERSTIHSDNAEQEAIEAVRDATDLDITTTKVVKDIVRRTRKKELTTFSFDEILIDDNQETDQDEYTPVIIDYSKRIEKEKQKSAAEIEKIAYFEDLQEKALTASKYSFGWFKTLLEMESINSGEANLSSRQVSIQFSKVEREPGTQRTLVLKHPNRYIPQFMEDLADIPLVLHMGDQTKTVAIEVANIKSYTLRVKLKKGTDIDGIDLSQITLASIDAKSPVFLIDELRKRFNELGEEEGFEDDYDMQWNLCKNIEFVFGPPGTGKTTHLARNLLLPMMRQSEDVKVLVLTPTNKSADVLINRIMEVSSDKSYERWLVRFGATGDEKIEQSPIYRDKTFDIRRLSRNVTVTTIARFSYDYFMPEGARIYLNGINWDYIVIDEASMIPIANIVYPLYKKTPRKIIIAGDPFQIEPITSVDLWKNENIYTMVELASFTNPQTVPNPYKVELLTTQYRSIPDIGYVFSNFVYGGILKHHRSSDSQRPLNVGDDLGVETLNIIKYPVSKYESIYRNKRLQHSSSYQVYSALFTFEYVCYLSKAIATNNPKSSFKIGIIAPYRAQADMIDKLLASENLPEEVDVQVGTIHGFQGDECDIVFAVFNTPPTISTSNEMFLNKKNIVNVSISRAKDYLFIVMPDDDTENIENLRLIKRVEHLIHDTDAWNEFLSPDLEELMFGDPKYLENNAFSTSHQSVNVYGLPEKRYEIRTEDAAVDVQIHKETTGGLIDYQGAGDKKEKHSADELSAYLTSSSLDESLIPEELRKGAIDLPVHGAINDWCYLVPYEGKLALHTLKKTVAMFIPQIRNGREKMVSVSVVEDDRIIYIPKDVFRLYEKGLSEPEGIELRRSFVS